LNGCNQQYETCVKAAAAKRFKCGPDATPPAQVS
jgi:hypothetical protein